MDEGDRPLPGAGHAVSAASRACSSFSVFAASSVTFRSGLGQDRHEPWAWRRCAWRFRTSSLRPADPQNAALLKTFNDTLWNDLDVSGVVELVSKSFYPLQVPGQPPEVNFLAWNAPPPNAAMLAFGNLGVAAGS